MDLYTLGFDAHSPCHSATALDLSTPSLTAKAVKVLWSSWCDAVIAHQDDANTWVIEYRGTSLTATQKGHLTQSRVINDAINRDEASVKFFGSTMHEGLLGVVISERERSKVTIFSSSSVELGVPEVQSHSIGNEYEILDIKVASAGDVFVSVKRNPTGTKAIMCMNGLSELRHNLTSNNVPSCPILSSFDPTEWCLNATTTTALCEADKVYTCTRDPRYPKCLARPFEASDNFEPVPYLSETRIRKIASGGYMTAAVSMDGELFLWGQACPGSTEELAVLKETTVQSIHGGAQDLRSTGISVEDEQDEFVKCLTVRIDGQEAIVYDVAVGSGHILVTARLQESGKQVLFVAGDNSRGQLGLDVKRAFVREFKEIAVPSGKNVSQLIATGWSSFVITQDQ
ncbi:hypothetical protein P153DRAFT_337366 [Dothidotthia symphoricarpi CBS 119687]|uniref:RCC1/BLIP-II n=1 Tax=Dothidotthia symphoricarpi CBS 119687 TaxID=1392245 RepID=A0A6A6AKY6_9PLEO|nr:uncharacterized protein P153DRAFT_337366 [Dothidotthia symphoricarpi CBS 119687]KAF2131111.1 hypothetical protein P153DRAFT_337366 [Dothidotthia symphoricarpi CBS 119687]